MKQKIWEKRFQNERQKVIGAALTLQALQKELAQIKAAYAQILSEVELLKVGKPVDAIGKNSV